MSGEERFVFRADTNLCDALELGAEVVEAFRRLGLRCIGKPGGEWCVATEKETLADAALFHERELEPILAELNRLKVPKPPPKPAEE